MTLQVPLPNGPSEIWFDDQKVPASDWVAETTDRVRFFGASCKQLRDTAALTPTFYGMP